MTDVEPIGAIQSVANLGGWGLAVAMLFAFGWYILRLQKRLEQTEEARHADMRESNRELINLSLGLQSALSTQEAVLNKVLDAQRRDPK